jgi:hypothetical protein
MPRLSEGPLASREGHQTVRKTTAFWCRDASLLRKSMTEDRRQSPRDECLFLGSRV